MPAHPKLPEQSLELTTLLGDLYEEIGLEMIYQPVVDLATGEVIDGLQRMEFALERKWKIEPIGVKTGSREQLKLLRLALNMNSRPMTRETTRNLLGWCLRRWHEQSDRSIARTIGKPGANKLVPQVRKDLESVGTILQHDTRKSGGKCFKACKPSKVYTRSQKDFINIQAVVEELGDQFPSGRVSRRKANQMMFASKRQKYADSAPEGTPERVKIFHQDFRDFEASGADLCIADPPWGTSWSSNRRQFAEKVASVLRPGGYACCFTGDHSMADFLDAYRAAGLTYRWMLAIVWADGPAMRNDGNVNTGKTPVLILQKGGIFKPFGIFKDVVISEGSEKRLHEWQQPLDACLSLVYTFSPGRGKVIDMTLGGVQE